MDTGNRDGLGSNGHDNADGSSNSNSKSNFNRNKYSDEDINRFKKAFADTNSQYEEMARSDRFLGQSDHSDNIPKSPYHTKERVGGSFHSPRRSPKKVHGQPWGKDPSSRPGEWLGGSGHSARSAGSSSSIANRSWRRKSAPGKTRTTVSSGNDIRQVNLDDSVRSFESESHHLHHRPVPPPMASVSSASDSTNIIDTDDDVAEFAGDGLTTTITTPSSSVHSTLSTKRLSLRSGGNATVSTPKTTPKALKPARGRWSVPSSPATPVAESIASVRASLKTPLMEKEKINQNKFLKSFELFERALEATEPQLTQQRVRAPKKSASLMPGAMRSTTTAKPAATVAHSGLTSDGSNMTEAPTSSSPSKPKKRLPKKSTSLISPRRNATRNFKISPSAVDAEIGISSHHSLNKNQLQSVSELSNLSSIIENLRKVKLDASKNRPGTDDSSTNQAAAELLAALKKLRRIRRDDSSDNGGNDDVLERLRSNGVLSQARLTPEDIALLQSVRDRLQDVHRKTGTSNQASADLTAVDVQLKRVIRSGSDHHKSPSGNNADSDGDDDGKESSKPPALSEQMLEDISNDLSKVVLPQFKGDQDKHSVVEGCWNDIMSILDRMRSQDESDLALALHQLSTDDANQSKIDGIDELRHILTGTNFPRTGEDTNPDEDELRRVIAKLNRTKLNRWEASKFSGFLVNLRKTKFPEKDGDLDCREVVQLRKVVPSEKMLAFEEVVQTARRLQPKLDDKVFDDIFESILSSAKGQPSKTQACQDELADAISKLRKVPMNHREAKQVSQVVYKLKKTPQQCKQEDEEHEEMLELKHVINDEPRAAVVEDAVKQIKRVRFDLDDEVFEFFVGDIVSMGIKTEDRPGEKSFPPPEDAGNESKPEGKKAGSSRKKPSSPRKPKKDKSKTAKSPRTPKPQSKVLSASSDHSQSSEYSDDGRKIVFNRKHHWKHKQHFNTVIGEKRWRKEEKFGADEVIYSPLSREQHDRRKAVSAALFQSMGAVDGSDDGGLVASTDILEQTLEATGVSMGELERSAASSKRTSLVRRSPQGKSPRKSKPASIKEVPTTLPL